MGVVWVALIALGCTGELFEALPADGAAPVERSDAGTSGVRQGTSGASSANGAGGAGTAEPIPAGGAAQGGAGSAGDGGRVSIPAGGAAQVSEGGAGGEGGSAEIVEPRWPEHPCDGKPRDAKVGYDCSDACDWDPDRAKRPPGTWTGGCAEYESCGARDLDPYVIEGFARAYLLNGGPGSAYCRDKPLSYGLFRAKVTLGRCVKFESKAEVTIAVIKANVPQNVLGAEFDTSCIVVDATRERADMNVYFYNPKSEWVNVFYAASTDGSPCPLTCDP